MLRRRSPLFSALLMLILCASVLVGSTYAQFTDQVVVSGNVITSGNLKASLDYWTKDAEGNGEWAGAENKAIFGYSYWEPGYTDVQYIKISNTGKLAFQYALSIEPVQQSSGGVNLMDVIDVYYGVLSPEQNMNEVPTDRAAFMDLAATSGLKKIGTLTQLNQMNSYTWGVVLPENSAANVTVPSDVPAFIGEAKACVVLHMQEEAGNEYMGQNAGGGFNLKLTATQYAYEEDAFGKDYDDIQMELFTPISLTIELPAGAVENGALLAEQKATDPNTGAAMIVPAGAKIAAGATRLTLNASMMSGTGSNVQLDEGEAMRSYDVHVDGLAADNTMPVQIKIPELMDKALNIGNYSLYHVENGATTPMTHVSTAAGAAHNSFTYDPATGDVTLCMATYSEVAVVAEEPKWEGGFDYSWYTNAVAPLDGEAVTEYTIANADQLAAFGAIVGGMNGQTQNSFSGKTVKLIADIDLGDKEEENNSGLIFYPIGYNSSDGKYEKTGVAVTTGFYAFEGTFDGQGHTISNFYHNTWEMKGDHDWYKPEEQYYRDGMGLFGKVYGGTVKNLTVNSFSSDGEIATTGVIAAYADGATFENIAITNCNPRVYNIGNGGIVGCVGWYAKEAGLKSTFKNITVDNSNKISALWGSYDVACGGLVGQYYPTSGQTSAGSPKNAGIDFVNCHVSAQMDVYNDVCGNYQYYAYRYAGMIIGSIRENTTNEDGKTIPNMTGISAAGCTVNYGDWNDYYYCEFVKNGHPSYSGPDDYKFSRVPHSELNFTDSNGNGLVDADERATVTGCKHNHTDAEDNQAIYLPFHQLFTGYGWGVNSVGLEKYSGIVTDLGITEGDQEESVVKFVQASNIVGSYTTETTVDIGELFDEVAEVKFDIDTDNVQVFVSPVGESSTAGAIYTADTTDWTQGTLKFSGLGAATITITDYYFCTPTTINVTIEDLPDQDKFIAQNPTFTHTIEDGTIEKTLGNIFSAVEGVTIDSENVTVTVAGNCVYEKNDSDWTKSTLAFTGTGTVTITITDKDYCKTETATVTINVPSDEKEKFDLVFPNTGKYIYRVGNMNTVALGSLFEGISDDIGDVKVTVSGNASSVYTANTSDWTKGTIQFSGTGFVTVTIDDNAYAKALTLDLEVVTAMNATSAANAKSNNVVLLNDVGLHTIEVSNGYTLYGNGFKMTAASDVMYDAMNAGFVTLKNGTLDNVQIICPNFSYSIVYNSQIKSGENTAVPSDSSSDARGNVRSAVMVNGNSKIVNSYVHGGRAAIFLRSGNLLVDGSTISGGAAANIHAVSAQGLTLRNATLIQKPFKANVNDTSKTIMGFSGLFECDENGNSTPLILEGTLVQEAWINESYQKYAPKAASSIVDIALQQKDYIHNLDLDGNKTDEQCLNLGFAFVPMDGGQKSNANVTDDRSNKNTIPYAAVTVSSANVYSYKNINGTSEAFKDVGDYVPSKQGTIAPIVSFTDTNENCTFTTEFDSNSDNRWESSLTVNLDNGNYTFSFANLLVQKHGSDLTYTVKTAGGTAVDTSKAIELKSTGVTEYVLTVTDGDVTHTIYFTLTATKTSIPDPVVADTTGGTPLLVVKSKNSDWTCALPALEGIKIKYYTADGEVILNLATLTPTSTGKQNGTNNYWETTKDGYKLKVTCGVIHDTKSVYGMPVVVDNNGTKQMYFTISSTNGYVSTNTAARSVTLTYEFTDPNGKVLTFTKNYNVKYADYKEVAQYKYSDFVNGTMNNLLGGSSGGNDGTCLAEGTMITLADGSKRAVEDLRKGDMVMAYDHLTGQLTSKPVIIVVKTSSEFHKNTFVFDDGTKLATINEHGIYDLNLNRYVNIDHLNGQDYIGHDFVAVDPNGNISTKKLIAVESEFISGYKYDIVTNGTLNYVAEDTLSVTHVLVDVINTFDFDENMRYDPARMEADIQKYGLYTYDEWQEYADISVFEEYNIPVMKVGISKGLYTKEYIVGLINTFVLDESVQIID